MKNAIRLYSDTANPDGFPGAVICEILLVEDDVASPPEGYSSIMTDEEVAAYVDAHADDYAAFETQKANLKIWAQSRSARRDGIKARIDWGLSVILDFRDYAVAKNLNPTDSVALLTAVQPILPYLQLGLLGPAAYLVGAVGANSFLDAAFDPSIFNVTVADGTTVKQYFQAKISEGNV